MKFIAGLIGLFVTIAIGAAVAAASRKRDIVPLDDEDANEVRLVAIFSPVAFHSTASAFRGGTLDCWYGGGIIDLRDATLDSAGAHLEVKAVFGGAQIIVPRDWRVEIDGNGVGGARDVRPSRDLPVTAPLLTITSFVLFGGIGVSSDIPKEALESVRAEMLKRRKSEAISSAATNGAAARRRGRRPDRGARVDLTPRSTAQTAASAATPSRAFISSRQRRNGTPPSTGQDGPLKPSVNWLNPIST